MIFSKTIYLEVKDFDDVRCIDKYKATSPLDKKQYIEKCGEKVFVWNNDIMIFNAIFDKQSYSTACDILKKIFKNE